MWTFVTSTKLSELQRPFRNGLPVVYPNSLTMFNRSTVDVTLYLCVIVAPKINYGTIRQITAHNEHVERYQGWNSFSCD